MMAYSNKNKLFALTTLASLMLCANSYASSPNLRIDGTIDAYVPLNKTTQQLASDSNTGKHIVFEKIVLSPQAKQWFVTSHTDSHQPASLTIDGLPAQIHLGMNGVPVLDQGRHGTCVTFATSGALDAIHGKSDYVSQLCSLELGAFLAKQNSEYPSGWDGSWAHYVLDQISTYGVISSNSQRIVGCAGVYAYPVNDATNTGHIMPAVKYNNRSNKIMSNISYTTLLNPNDAFSDKIDMTVILSEVKQALNEGNRVLIGTLLDISVGHNGALGTYKVKNDTWMLTPEIKKHAQNNQIIAGHEMIITGYDDNAEVIGPDHTKQVGVLTLRNSWGADAGDNGNYYMTYAHFKLLAMEINSVVPEAKAKN